MDDLVFTRQTAPAAGYVSNNTGDSIVTTIANALSANLQGQNERRYRDSLSRLANEQSTDLQTYRSARQRLGEMIAGQFAIRPEEVKQRLFAEGTGVTTAPMRPDGVKPEGVPLAPSPVPDNLDALKAEMAAQILQQNPGGYTVLDPTEAEQLGASRAIAAERLTPEFVANVLGTRVQAGDASAAGGNIGDVLANLAVGAMDPDMVAGFRGTALNPGQQVFQTGADEMERYQQGEDTARNNADNATTQRGQDVSRQTQLDVANINASVNREEIAASNAATSQAAAQSRAARLDQQTVNAAVNQALGIRNNVTPPGPSNYRARVMARTTELLRGNENLDATTAAAIAVQELLNEEPASEGFMGMGRHGRRYTFTPEGENYVPVAPATAAALNRQAAAPDGNAPVGNGGLPAGAMVDDATGEVFDANGRLIGRVRSGQ